MSSLRLASSNVMSGITTPSDSVLIRILLVGVLALGVEEPVRCRGDAHADTPRPHPAERELVGVGERSSNSFMIGMTPSSGSRCS